MNRKRSAQLNPPKGDAIRKAAKGAAIVVGVLVYWIYISSGPKGLPARGGGRSFAAEPASHIAGPAALEVSAATSSARYSAMAASYFAANTELSMVRSYAGAPVLPMTLARSENASSSRYVAMAASYLAGNPELSLLRSTQAMVDSAPFWLGDYHKPGR